MLKQTQQQRLIQRLSPQQIQFMRLLQVSTAALEERIKDEMEENPILEYDNELDNNNTQAQYNYELIEGEDKAGTDTDSYADYYEKMTLDNYIRNEEDDSGTGEYFDSEKSRKKSIYEEATLHQYLEDQLQVLDITEDQQKIGLQIIGSIDADGYLRRTPDALVDDLAFSQNVATTYSEVVSIVKHIQSFDPAGVGAQTLQECLMFQLERMQPTEDVKWAMQILSDHFLEFTKKHYDKILRALNIRYDQFKKAIDTIIRLNPKPGSAFGGGSEILTYVVPDFFIENNNGVLEVILNSKNAPELRISQGYREMMVSFEKTSQKNKAHKETITFIKQKLDSAKWFIDCIKQRQYTLLQTMNAIVTYQRDFFLTGDQSALRPMILKDIATIAGFDVSTISRVANSKYVQTEFGVFSLKYFFSDGFSMEGGEEVSNKEIKSILANIVAHEDKHRPYQDEVLVEMLEEMGYSVARRTVAKYREQLHIPVARLRKGV